MNKTLAERGAPKQKIDFNSQIMRDIAINVGVDGMHEVADAIKEAPYFFYIKVGHEELINRTIQALDQLVNVEKKYSAADVKDMAQGLKLPPKLQTFIDDLGNGRALRPQSDLLPADTGPKVAKLQVVPAN